MMYLHPQNIVHGDLKAVLLVSSHVVLYLSHFENFHQNVLVDDSGKALLCDFGLARFKANITTRTMETDAVAMAGSRHWMTPERLRGRALRKPCDIYSFGITSYEVIPGSKEYIIVLNEFTRFMSMRPRSVMLVMPKSAILLCANKPSQNDRTRMRHLNSLMVFGNSRSVAGPPVLLTDRPVTLFVMPFVPCLTAERVLIKYRRNLRMGKQ